MATAQPAAPPTPQEIQRKLGSPTLPAAPGPTLSSSLESVDLQRRLSSASRRAHGSMSSGDEEDSSSPPMRGVAHLSAISETDDALASGSESDASSIGERRGSRPAHPQLDPVRTSRDSGGLSENVALKSGYLMKKGEKRKTWKKRWFVLRGGQLAMYKTDKEYRLLRLIPITDIHSVSPVELKKHFHAFGIVTPRRTYYVEASSPDEVQSWCRLISRATDDYRSRATVTSMDTPSGTNTEQPTPVGPSPAQTPRAVPHDSFSPATNAIPIPSSSPSGAAQLSSSPSAFAPSSYASTSSQSYAHGSVPPTSSFAPSPPGGGLGLQGASDLELRSLDAGISQLSLGSVPAFDPSSHTGRGVPQRSASGVSDTLSLPPPPPGPGGMLQVPMPSPGVASSSEDEDGFETYEQQFGSPGSYLPQPQQAQQFQQQQQPGPFAQQQQQPPSALPMQVAPPVVAGPADPNKVILTGYLMKQGKRKNWRKRWFVLQSSMLMYSRSHMDTKFHRQIPLTSILDAIEYDPSAHAAPSKRGLPLSSSHPLSPSSPSSGPSHPPLGDRNYEHCFKIITPKRTYLCCAPNEEDEIKWLAALQCLVARRTQAAVNGSSSSSLPPPPARDAQRSMSLPRPVSSLSPSSVAAVETDAVGALPQRTASQSAASSGRPTHGRQRSVTDAARQAVKDVERRFHPPASAAAA
ncbi:hypothetical protein JCM8547_007470 [Rhodosporidiobolus lusitaniae]